VQQVQQDIRLGLQVQPLEPLEPLEELEEAEQELLILQGQMEDQLQVVTVLLEHHLLEEVLEDQL
jgi:hypothetical protein